MDFNLGDTVLEMLQNAHTEGSKETKERIVKLLRALEKEGKQPSLQWIIDYVEKI